LIVRGGLKTKKRTPAYENAVNPTSCGTSRRPLNLIRRRTPLTETGNSANSTIPSSLFSFPQDLIFKRFLLAPVHHCSTILRAANGDRSPVCTAGTYESPISQTLFLAPRKPGRRTGNAAGALQNALTPTGNGVIFRDAGDRLWSSCGAMEGTRPMRRGSGGPLAVFWRTSTDHGVTWRRRSPECSTETLW